MWRSPVAHLLREQGAAGSNPVIPTIFLSYTKNNCIPNPLGLD